MEVGIRGEERLRVAGQGDDLHRKPAQRRHQDDQFIRLPGVAERKHHIAIGHDTEIPVQGIERIEHHGRAARAGEGRGDFLADMPALANPHHDHLVPLFHRGDQKLDGLRKLTIQPVAHLADRGKLDIKNTLGFFQEIHCGELCSRDGAAASPGNSALGLCLLELNQEFGQLIERLGGVGAIGDHDHPGAAIEIGAENVQDARGGIFGAVLPDEDGAFESPGAADEFRGGARMQAELIEDGQFPFHKRRAKNKGDWGRFNHWMGGHLRFSNGHAPGRLRLHLRRCF